MITNRIVLYSFYANLLLTLIILVFATKVIDKQDNGLKKLNALHIEYKKSKANYISCKEFSVYMYDLGIEVICGED